MPAIDRKMVVLPDPEGPKRTAIPCRTAKLASSAKVTRPFVLNSFLILAFSIGSGTLRWARQDIGEIDRHNGGEGQDQSQGLGLPVLSRYECFENR